MSRARVGLTDFVGLTKAVADKLAIGPNSSTRKLIEAIEGFPEISGVGSLVSADRVFGLIEREFLSRDIQAAIASALKPTGSLDLSAHRTLLDLARGPDGRTRLVTTNFDLLFEACDPKLASFSPPRLPDPMRDDEFFGIVHLHGCVTKDYSGAAGDGFVISSAEFGRAYLSERWATDFIRGVLERYIVVFVGYAADDPPMQYLLEALNRTSGSLSGVYAFQSGSKEDAEARWVQKGVHPIAYDARSNHDGLWTTLDAWAARARDPVKWHNRLLRAAKRGPENFEPHQRGQIAHIVSTVEGARNFSRVSSPPAASWLCTFDPLVRYSAPSRRYSPSESGAYFDPFDAYGLDSDPVPKKADPDDPYSKRDIPTGLWDCFVPTRQDRLNLRDDQYAAFRGHYSKNVPALTSRLALVESWLASVANQPAAVWWAAGQASLHPNTRSQIAHEIVRNGASFPAVVRKAWHFIFEAWNNSRNDSYRDWYDLAESVKIEGWTEPAIRQIGKIKSPYLSVRRPFHLVEPPKSKNDLHLLVTVDVKYPEIDEHIDVPSEYLPLLLKELRQNLELFVSLENELGGYGLKNLDPIEPDDGAEDETHPVGISLAVLEFVKYFRLLVASNMDAAASEAKLWRANSDELFARLTIWACGIADISRGADAADVLTNLEQNAFWDSRGQRDLLLTLSRRWEDFGAKGRKTLERKLLKGRSRWKREKQSEFRDRRASQILTRLHWLAEQGCKFSFDLNKETERLKAEAKEWKRSYASHAAASMASRTGFVQTVTESDDLLRVPLSDVLSKAEALSGRRGELFVEYDPFAGLVATRPVRALAALSAAEAGYDTTWAWQTFLNSQDQKKQRSRFSVVVAERLCRLSNNEFVTLIRPISSWLLQVSKTLIVDGRTKFYRLWERLILALTETPDKHSAFVHSKQREWATDALNSPAGYMAQALMNDLGASGGESIPADWMKRADELLSLPGSPRKHALAIFSHQLVYLYQIDAAWTERALLSAITAEDKDDAAAFWAGFFWAARTPQQTLYLKMKPALLALAHEASFARRQHAEILAGMLLIGWSGRISDSGERAVTSDEMRAVIVEADDEFRSQVVWQLDTWSKDATGIWPQETLIFLKEVWPKQLAAKSSGVSARLAELAFSHTDNFPEYVDAVLPLVITINQDHLRLPTLYRSAGQNVIDQYPEKSLELLSAILPSTARGWPYGMEEVLNRLGAAAPALLKDRRLVELNRIWNAR